MLEPLPGGCADGARGVQASQLGVLRSDHVTADIPPGPATLRAVAGLVQAGLGLPDARVQRAAHPVDLHARDVFAGCELTEAGDARLGQPQPGGGLLLLGTGRWLGHRGAPDQGFEGQGFEGQALHDGCRAELTILMKP